MDVRPRACGRGASVLKCRVCSNRRVNGEGAGRKCIDRFDRPEGRCRQSVSKRGFCEGFLGQHHERGGGAEFDGRKLRWVFGQLVELRRGGPSA